MKLLSAISLLLLASSYTTAVKHGNIRSTIAMLDDAEQQQTQQEAPEHPHRRGKKTSSSSSSGDNGDDRGDTDGDVIPGIGDPGLIEESKTCMPFTNPAVAISIAKGQTTEGHTSECDTNSCGSSGSPGCCRFHTSLLRCDENDDYPHQAVRVIMNE
jgi:hypothetical protein